jgi:hypothetical protein
VILLMHARQIAEDALNRDFTGRMAAYKKDDLRALAIAISTSDKGTNAEILARIEGHFEQHPDLKRNSRFSSLFNKPVRSAQRKGPSVPSNEGQLRQEDECMPGLGLSGPSSWPGLSDHPQPPPPSAFVASSSHHHLHQHLPSNPINSFLPLRAIHGPGLGHDTGKGNTVCFQSGVCSGMGTGLEFHTPA